MRSLLVLVAVFAAAAIPTTAASAYVDCPNQLAPACVGAPDGQVVCIYYGREPVFCYEPV